jgi:hypothetical protein
MRFFDSVYSDLSQEEKDRLKPSELFAISQRKDRLEAWLKTAFDGEYEMSRQYILRLEEDIVSWRVKLVNGDQGAMKRLFQLTLQLEEARKNKPFFDSEYLAIFGEAHPEIRMIGQDK